MTCERATTMKLLIKRGAQLRLAARAEGIPVAQLLRL
eukprot:COSAG03_NODE_22290_length_293_cov_0.613402_1_plen_36_part_10